MPSEAPTAQPTAAATEHSSGVVRGKRSKYGWGLLDQTLSSATNFGGSILTAGALTSSDFGAVAIGFSVFLLVLGISRSWSSEPLVIGYSSAHASDRMVAVARAAGSSLAIGLLAGALTGTVALAFDGALRSVLLVVAISLPFARSCRRLAPLPAGQSVHLWQRGSGLFNSAADRQFEH